MSDSVRVSQGYRVSTELSNGEVTTHPSESGWWRLELGWEGEVGEDMTTSSVDISFWNLGWD